MNLLDLRDLTVRRGARTVLEGVSLTVAAGEVVGLIGPNGAGKTTLLRAALGLIPAAKGSSNLAAMPARTRARAAAWLPQAREIAWPVSVTTLVALGRRPHAPGPADQPAIEAAIAAMDLDALRARPATQLSGGEQARVLIARALAQEAPLLIADEPTAGLDTAHQLALMALFADLAASGRGVLVTLHDLALATLTCHRVVVLSAGGRVMADGPPSEVLSDALLAEVFAVEAVRIARPQGTILAPVRALR
ncbi:ABC transporter ATP-binding protein [Paracoccus suum]|uniref:ABC transporter ATP-binding protein n=1 Tax=Paracoccus suum TaxID=2259340 RepID=A0A344PJM5_9RHOB|nr:ABC transporter ATP-binding protein [Paracoccus suum]AXC49580.1 ABC transporter ATP-binding protein [Paracoccus suum]